MIGPWFWIPEFTFREALRREQISHVPSGAAESLGDFRYKLGFAFGERQMNSPSWDRWSAVARLIGKMEDIIQDLSRIERFFYALNSSTA